MKKTFVFILIVIASIANSQTVNEDYADGRIYFKLKNDAPIYTSLKGDPRDVDIHSYSFLTAICEQYPVKKISRPFYAAKESNILQHTFELQLVNYTDVNSIIRQLQSSSLVEYAERVPLNKMEIIPNDVDYSSQWELTKIDAANAWNYSTGSSNVVVAIVDDAVELTHPDLAANIWINPGEIAANGIDDDNNGYIDDINGYDVADDDNNPNPTTSAYSHGTQVAGMAAARSNNSIGGASIGYSIKIMAVKSSQTGTDVGWGYNGLIYAIAAGAKIINCSWSASVPSITGQNIINYGYGKGCLIIAAAGNQNSSALRYPAANTNVLAVAATGSTDVKNSSSNYGSYVDLCAPGQSVHSTGIGGTYTHNTGTSLASPMVAGLCGLMLSLNPHLTNVDLETCLKNNADNIDAQNPSYIGQLGSGRINANKAMQCVQASLTWKPTSDFAANFTTISTGGKVTFTDKSTHNPTSWTWTFTGGTPSGFVGPNPPIITYSSVGTYNVTLVTGNTNGSDTQTKTAYITVTAAGGCASMNLIFTQGTTPAWTPMGYGASSTNPADKDGYVIGLNGLDGDKQKAQYFDASTTSLSILTRAYIQVAKAYSTNLNKTISVNVYDGTSGSPGTLLGSTTKTLQQCRNAYLSGKYLDVTFRPAINLPASHKFFIGIDYSNLDWATSKDSLLIVCNKHGQTSPGRVWEQKTNNSWFQLGQSGAYWAYQGSMYIFPFITDKPVIVNSSVNPKTICQGSSVTMDATGSTYEDKLIWNSPGGSPASSNTVSQNVIFNSPGIYTVKLYVTGGGCHEADSVSTTITVNPTPSINISSSLGTTFCSGSSTALNVSGATGNYSWSPSTGLSGTTGTLVTASPTSDITYNITGASNGCVGSSAISIKIDNPVSVTVTTSPVGANVCKSAPLTFDASASANVSTYSWSFPGGSPLTSNLAKPTVTYANNGLYTATLAASNSCGTNNSYSQMVNVLCTGVDELFNSENIKTMYNPIYKKLSIVVNDNFNINEPLSLKLIDLLGQVVYSGKLSLSGNQSVNEIEMPSCSTGVYTIQLSGSGGIYNHKFMVE